MKRASSLVPGLHRSSLLKKPEDEMLQEGEVISVVTCGSMKDNLRPAVILSFHTFASNYMASKQSES